MTAEDPLINLHSACPAPLGEVSSRSQQTTTQVLDLCIPNESRPTSESTEGVDYPVAEQPSPGTKRSSTPRMPLIQQETAGPPGVRDKLVCYSVGLPTATAGPPGALDELVCSARFPMAKLQYCICTTAPNVGVPSTNPESRPVISLNLQFG